MDYSFGTEFPAQSLIDILRDVNTRVNRNKNDICQTIDLSEKTIVDWYNRIIHAYAPFRACFIKGEQIDTKTLTEFLIFADSRTDSHAIKSTIFFLNEIKKKYEKGELKNIIEKIDIKLFGNFISNLNNFYSMVFERQIILEDGIPMQKGSFNDAKKIGSWIHELDEIQDNVRSDAVVILKQLDCRKQVFNKLSNNSK